MSCLVAGKCPDGPFGQIDPDKPYEVYVTNSTLHADSTIHVKAVEGELFTLRIEVRDCPDNTTFQPTVPDSSNQTVAVRHYEESCLYVLRFTFWEIQKNDAGLYSCVMTSPVDAGQNYTCQGVYLDIGKCVKAE